MVGSLQVGSGHTLRYLHLFPVLSQSEMRYELMRLPQVEETDSPGLTCNPLPEFYAPVRKPCTVQGRQVSSLSTNPELGSHPTLVARLCRSKMLTNRVVVVGPQMSTLSCLLSSKTQWIRVPEQPLAKSG